MAYDLPGNVGWIVYITALILCFAIKPDYMQLLLTKGIVIAAIVPAILMLIGIIELIHERIAKLDRILPKSRVLRGFGALTLGGVLGVVISLIGIIIGIVNNTNVTLPIVMCVGGLLCGVFAGLLFNAPAISLRFCGSSFA